MNNTTLAQKLFNLESNLSEKISKYKKVTEEYIEKVEELEKRKLEIIDPSKRDSIEKQLMAAMQNDQSLQELFLKVERLRREKDLIAKEIDSIKTMISLNQTILNQGV